MTDILQNVKFTDPYVVKLAQQTINFVHDRAKHSSTSDVDVSSIRAEL